MKFYYLYSYDTTGSVEWIKWILLLYYIYVWNNAIVLFQIVLFFAPDMYVCVVFWLQAIVSRLIISRNFSSL